MEYNQLTYKERYLIERCHQNGESQTLIANKLNRSKSTVCRELNRNSEDAEPYQARQAQRQAKERASGNHGPRKLTDKLWNDVARRIRQYWSPEQIADHLDSCDGPSLSHEWIYQMIYANQAGGGDLWEYMRHPRKKRRQQRPEGETRGKIPGRTSIHDRPEIVEQKSRTGDWEIDLVEGAKGEGYLLSLVERKTAFSLIGRLKQATAREVAKLTVKLLRPYKPMVHTITSDNGKEFANHGNIADKLDCQMYFADPHSPWQRGLNENTNGLLRQFFPKGCDMNQFETKHLRAAMYLLNHRPRKTLEFQKPYLLFSQSFP